MRRAVPLAVLLLSMSGCYESFQRPPGSDAGEVLDAGTLDAGSPDAAGASVDAGEGEDAGIVVDVCAGELVEEPTLRCSEATRTCLAACTEPRCADACVTNDPTCLRCLDETIVSCGNELGCQPVWDEFACCAHMMCPEAGAGVDRLECASSGACISELEGYIQCLDGAIELCEPRISGCFEPG